MIISTDMADKYDPKKIEAKWQKEWAKKKLYKTKEVKGKKSCYVLDMFPYPSGEGLHVGHPKGYIATDIYSRFKKMSGFNILHPMGWDAFGLPAENYAIKNKVHPEVAVKKNIKRFKEQLSKIGFNYDWEREISTTDPEYYRWTQWIFLQMYKKGLAYESNEPINWCPSCKTGLANEDLEDGKCERCGSVVEQKPLRQWVLKITDYADRMLEDLSLLPKWPESIKESQKNWIGKSDGAEIDFRIGLENKKPRFVVIHGYTGSSTKNFIPWLKKELEAKGYEVETPELPNTNNPKESEQVEYVLRNCKLDENTVVIGHSLGAVVAMKTIMKLNKMISGLVVVGAAIEPKFHSTSKPRPFWDTFSWSYDYEKIKKLTQGRIAVLSDLKEKHRVPYLKFLSEKLSGALIEVEAEKEHFCAIEEPSILKSVTPEVTVFTTRPDTLFGVTYLVLAPEHPWVEELASNVENKNEVKKYINDCKNKSEKDRTVDNKEKTGVELKGVFAINPANNEKIPVWIADYVLASYGTGAVMAVPAHDERDFEFAKKYGLPIKEVVGADFVLDGQDAPKNGFETLERRIVDAVIENDKGEFLLVKENDNNIIHYHLVGGGTDGEDDLLAIKREIVEETGYDDFEVISKVCDDIHCHAFRHTKNKNQKTIGPAFYVKLKSDHKIRSEVDDGKHEIVWVEKNKVKNIITWAEHSHIWNKFVNPNSVNTGNGRLINSDSFNGLTSEEACKKITEFVGGRIVTKYKLRDWVFSRQRYWGEPIPLIHCEKCGVVPVPEKDLPVKLPKVKHYEPTGTGESPLAGIDKWVNVKCPECKGKAKRETNTMPQWAGSCWYYLRFIDPKNKKVLVDKKKEKSFMPISLYVGGAEHATRHLIYARFWHKFLYDQKIVSTKEPFERLHSVGLIAAEDGRKMSKRYGNVINPDDIIALYGADTLRVYEMFMGPFGAGIAWSTNNMIGSRRFIERVWNMIDLISKKEEENVIRELHKTIKKVGEGIESFSFNTAISAMMIFVNTVYESKSITKKSFENFIQILSPFAPHATEELWKKIGGKKSIYDSSWPKYNEKFLKENRLKIAVQINGKVRAEIEVSEDDDEKEIERIALENDKIKSFLQDKIIKKIIVIRGKIVSIVI